MDIELALKLTALALIDATSLGTLVIPVWLLLTPGRPRIGRILTYLGTVVAAYFVLGLALLAGLMAAFERFSGWLRGDVGNHVMLYGGLAMLAAGICMPSRDADAGPGRVMRYVAQWRERALGDQGGTRALMTLAVIAVVVEAASMLPYLAGLGLMSTMDGPAATRVIVLAGYCAVMVTPALVLVAARVALGARLDSGLRRLGAWVERSSGESVAWALAIIGVVLVRSAWSQGARLPWGGLP